MSRNQTKIIAYNGLLLAIILVLTIVPNIGFIQIPPLSLTIIHIPVIIGAILFEFKSAIFLSLAFGVSSMFVAATRGAGLDVLFINPLVSVLPRLLFGLAIYLIYTSIKRAVKSKSLQVGITAFVSSLIHSFLVLFAMYLATSLNEASFTSNAFTAIISSYLFLGAIGEAILATIISIPVVTAVRRVID